MLESKIFLQVTMHFSVIILDELLNEGSVLVQNFVTHVRNVVQHGLILHHEVLLQWRPRVHRRNRIDCIYDL